jgi:cysteine-S-conjugate beta-lyase
MMKFNFDREIDRSQSDSVKWSRSVIEELGGNPDAVPFWVADMDFPPPPSVLKAIQDRASHPIFGYSAFPRELPDALQSWLKYRHSWETAIESLVFVPGMMTGIAVALTLLTRPGNGVILQTPAYNPFFSVIEKNGRVVARNPLLRDGSRYVIDFQHLEELLSKPENTALLFCSPHNPAGRVWTREELDHTAELCRKYRTAVISDEIHADLAYPEAVHIPFSSLASSRETVSVTFTAPSKTFNIAGEKLAAAVISDKELREKFNRFLEGSALSHLPIFAPAAALAAYTGGHAWLRELTGYLQENLAVLREYLERFIPEMELIEPEASFIAFIDCSRLLPLTGGTSPAKFFSLKAGVLLHDGSWFGPEGRSCVRINFGTQRARLRKALEKMRTAIESVRRG